MIRHFDHLGVVEVRPGPADRAFPAEIEVEERHELVKDVIRKPHPAEGGKAVAHGIANPGAALNGLPPPGRAEDLTTIEKVRRFAGAHRVRRG